MCKKGNIVIAAFFEELIDFICFTLLGGTSVFTIFGGSFLLAKMSYL
jgi:hypothetical protein